MLHIPQLVEQRRLVGRQHVELLVEQLLVELQLVDQQQLVDQLQHVELHVPQIR